MMHCGPSICAIAIIYYSRVVLIYTNSRWWLTLLSRRSWDIYRLITTRKCYFASWVSTVTTYRYDGKFSTASKAFASLRLLCMDDAFYAQLTDKISSLLQT